MPETKRQLAAIMFTDIVGYTALMGKDSAKALELIRISKDIQKPLVEKHNGKWLKEMGDGAMAQFSTALDAVNCSIEIQKSARAELDAKLRIGIHLGDVTVEQDDVHGDGVNVASRLESIADPGGVYISESIEKAIKGQTDVQAKYLGEIKLKNVAYGVRTYALQGVGLPVPEVKGEKELSGRFWAELQRRSVLRVALTYIMISWLLLQIGNMAFPVLGFSSVAITVLSSIVVFGFPVAIFLAWKYERSPEGYVRTTSQASWQNPYSASKKKPLTSGVVIAVLALIIVFLYFFPQRGGRLSSVDQDRAKTIAVLPFIDLSEKGDQQFFADGVMEDILGQLQKMKELHVVSRTSVMKYRGKAPTIKQIRDELKVSYVLEASIRKSPDQIMITVQLIDVAEDRHLFSENYTSDYSAKGIFEIQGRIAKRIVTDLKLTISPENLAEITQAMTENTIAYEHFQKGRNYKSRNTLQDTDSSIIEFKKAIQIDPGFASAYGLLANMFWVKTWVYNASITFVDSAEFYARKGLKFDDYCAWCYRALGGVEFSKYGNRVKQLELQEKALEINPNFGAVMQNMILVYYSVGEYEKAIKLVSRYLKVVPNAVPTRLRQLNQHLGDVLKEKAYFDLWVNKREVNEFNNNQSDEYAEIQFDIGDVEGFKNGANRAFQTGQDSTDFHWAIIGSYWLEKKYDEVTAYYEENQNLFLNEWPPELLAGGIIVDLGGYRYLIKLPAFSYLRMGKNTEASQLGGYWLEKLEKADKSLKWTVYNISLAYLLKHQKEQSVNWLERAIDSGHLEDISKDVFFESLYDHPRFKELVAKQQKKREELLALVATYDFPEPEDL